MIYGEKCSGKILIFESEKKDRYIYYEAHSMLIPLKQPGTIHECDSTGCVPVRSIDITNRLTLTCDLLKADDAEDVFRELKKIKEVDNWKINEKLWWVKNSKCNNSASQMLVYDGKKEKVENFSWYRRANYIQVIYLLGKHDAIYLQNNCNLRIVNSIFFENDSDEVNNQDLIQELLDCDKKRCGLSSYERERLFDIQGGHWDVYENQQKYVSEKNIKLVPRDPKKDIKKNGVIGIDFGTKSTVVVKQEGKNEIRPIRIGSLSLSANVDEEDYENPTIISCMSIDNFLKKYEEKQGRPETSCEDIFVSYNAYEDYKNCRTEDFYAFYPNLKQWANKEKEEVILQDSRDKKDYKLGDENSIEEKTINPIEIYAYYIGMYINNMRNGIYLKYIMSFPVKYSKSTKDMIRKSFEKGIKKSLPNTIVEDPEYMKDFSVEYGISEPAAYAVTALEQSGFKPEDENEKYLYGIFDFGGGTTDFDFGVWRGASDDEYDRYNCDYVLECFGADSDENLGGEKLLEMLAYYVFKENKNMAAEKKISCALPVGEVAFLGGENLINNSQSSNRNLTILKEALRPLWEQQDRWEEKYQKKNTGKDRDTDEHDSVDEYMELQMYDVNGKMVPNCRFDVDTSTLLDFIRKRIQRGVDAFFNCIEKSILLNKSAQCASEKVYIFLAGNSCKSVFVKEAFKNTIKEYNKEYGRGKNQEQDRFTLIEPLKGNNQGEHYIPNGKTSVAYGLLKSRPGGKIFIKKNYETDSEEEARFKYYLGVERRGLFYCKLSPTIKGEDGKSHTSYNIWNKFQGAGMGVARIYYTSDPRSDSNIEKISIDNIPFHEISFEADENKYLYIKAVGTSRIEYAVAESEEQINEVCELDIDSE